MADHIVRPIIRSIIRPIIRALTAPAGGGSAVDPTIPLGLLSKLRGWYGLQDSYADDWGAWPLVDVSSGAGSFADASAFGSGLAGRCLTGSRARTRINVPNYGTGKSFFIGALRSTNAFTANQFTAFMGKATFNDSLALSEHAAGFQSRGVLDSAGPATYLANAASSANTWHLTIAQHSAAGTVRNHQDTTLNAATDAGNANLNPTDFLSLGNVARTTAQSAEVALLFWGEGEITQDEMDYLYNEGAGRTLSEILVDAGYALPTCRMTATYPTVPDLTTSYDGLTLAVPVTTNTTHARVGNTSRTTGLYCFAMKNYNQLTGGARTTSLGVMTSDGVDLAVLRLGGAFNGQVSVAGAGFTDGTDPGATTGIGAPNDWFTVAVNLNTKKVWVGKNNTWAGDPVAGTGHAASYTGSLALLPTVLSAEEAFSCKMAFTTADYPYSHPSGFTPWGDA